MPSSPNQQFTVLCVDDNDSQRYALTHMLKSAGFKTVETTRGEDALKLAHQEKLDLILLDVALPDMDGIEVCRQLKADPELSAIPILQLSATFVSTQDKVRALEGGADGYIISPFEPLEIITTIKALIRNRQAIAETRQQSQQALEELAHRKRVEQELYLRNKELEHALVALKDSERHFRAVFQHATDGMVIWNRDGKFEDLNPSACDLLGESRDELLGRSFENFLEGSHRKEFARDLRAGSGEIAYKGEFETRTKNGELRFIEYSATINFLPGKHLSILRDITGRKAAEEQSRKFNEILERRVVERTVQLEETNRELEAFSYSVSHDLRAPFRHIVGFSELLLKRAGNLDATSRHYVKTIADSARYAGSLVDSLLSFSQMARTQVNVMRVDLNLLAEEVRREVMIEIPAGHRVVWNMGSLPVVTGDPMMLRLVFRNLFSNAIKYSRNREESVIEVGYKTEGEEHVIYVKDNGVGFDMQYAHKLFGVFQRLHRIEEFEGTGIGLANVRRIIQRHGGRTWAESVLEKGSTFYFTLAKRAEEMAYGGPEANLAGRRQSQ